MDDATEARGLANLAYDLSLKALARQERVLDDLRARTGTMLAASSIAASFLGAQAADRGTGVLTVFAVLAFVCSIATGTYVLLPKSRLIFALRGSVLFEREFEDAIAVPETYRRLAYWLEGYYDDNQSVIDRLFKVFRLATVAIRSGATLDLGDRHLMAQRPAPAPPPPPPPNLGIPETKSGNKGETRSS